jgi:hypothetical protein
MKKIKPVVKKQNACLHKIFIYHYDLHCFLKFNTTIPKKIISLQCTALVPNALNWCDSRLHQQKTPAYNDAGV